MRIMMMHKHDPKTEAGVKPPPELVHEMGSFIGEFAKTGRLIDGAGLGASKTRTRLQFRNGECTTKHGPYQGEHELPAASLLLKVKTREEVFHINSATRSLPQKSDFIRARVSSMFFAASSEGSLAFCCGRYSSVATSSVQRSFRPPSPLRIW